MAITITADQAQDGDVVQDGDKNVYQLIGGGVWGNVTPVPTMSGPLFKPEGELTLLARGGEPAGARDTWT